MLCNAVKRTPQAGENMNAISCSRWAIAMLAGGLLALGAGSSYGQVQRRYQPSRPTVSPYLNLFRFNNSVIPNYQSLVRPEQEALRFRQEQQQYDRQQTQQLNQLKSSVQVLQQPAVTTKLVAPTGNGSWFNREGGASFQNTSRFYSQSGGDANTTAPRR
jgi:hypothetical protein